MFYSPCCLAALVSQWSPLFYLGHLRPPPPPAPPEVVILYSESKKEKPQQSVVMATTNAAAEPGQTDWVLVLKSG